jgi:hypothetical protein
MQNGGGLNFLKNHLHPLPIQLMYNKKRRTFKTSDEGNHSFIGVNIQIFLLYLKGRNQP